MAALRWLARGAARRRAPGASKVPVRTTRTRTPAVRPGGSAGKADEATCATLSNLSAVLGEEAEDADGDASDGVMGPAPATEISVAPAVLQTLQEAEAARSRARRREPTDPPRTEEDGAASPRAFLDRLRARQEAAVRRGEPISEDELNREVEAFVAAGRGGDGLGSAAAPSASVNPADVERMKEEVFGMGTFWVTGTEPSAEIEGAVVFKGNLRLPHADALSAIDAALDRTFGTDVYAALLVEEPVTDLEGFDPSAEPRAAVVVAPAARLGASDDPPLAPFTSALSLFASGGVTYVLALAWQLASLPAETLEFLASPEGLAALEGLPGAAGANTDVAVAAAAAVTDAADAAFPGASAILAASLAHDLAHRALALKTGVPLGWSWFLPSLNLGTYGPLTPFKRLTPTRTDLFDISAAGPVAGASVAAGLFVYGLALSGGETPGLVPVPPGVLDGSLVLGGITRAVLGVEEGSSSPVMVHPILIAGWSALAANAYAALPVGRLDGGRMVMAAWGRGALAISSVLTYLGLLLGLLGGDAALLWLVFTFLFQREPERPSKDDITALDSDRTPVLLLTLAFVVAVLLPGGPGLDGADALDALP